MQQKSITGFNPENFQEMRWKHQDPAATSQALLAFLVSSGSLPTAAAAAQIVFVAWRAQGWAEN